jgi:hypothetical protein
MHPRDVALTITRGGATFTALALAGKIGPREAWIGMRGAARYLEAVAAGDVAPEAAIEARLRVCRACPARTADEDVPEAAGYCGPAFAAAELPDGPTCGCALEGKASVASEVCPRGRW